MKNLTEKEKDFIVQQIAEFFYEYFRRRYFREKRKNGLRR